MNLFIAIVIVLFLIYAIPKFGLLLLVLKCPNCAKRGYLRRLSNRSALEQLKIEQEEYDLIDLDMALKNDRIIVCKNCRKEIELAS